jgi:hypothetical protein
MFTSGMKKHLALDTDWVSATAMVCLFLISAMLLAGNIWRADHGRVALERVSWDTWILLGICAWFFVLAKQRDVRYATGLLALSPVSRVILWAVHASVETQLVNAAFLSVINVILFAGVCGYVVWWFGSKVRHV